ncbi:MAG: GNAT family N-acetyltransferase [Arsenophonus endosymbiont of Dermacentor nuttalli]
MEHVANYGRQHHYQHIILSTQCSAPKFYCSLGYNIIDDGYDEDGVPYIKMVLTL